MKSVSIRVKVILAIVACMSVVALALIFNLKISYDENIRMVDINAVRDAAAVFNSLKDSDTKKLSATLTALLEVESYKKFFEKNQRAALLKATTPVFEQLRDNFGITNWAFLNPESLGTAYLKVQVPKSFGDDCTNRITYQNAVKTKTFSSGIEQATIAIALRVDHPWYDNGQLIGYIELAQKMDDFLGRMKKQTSNDYALLIDKKYMNQKNWTQDRAGKGQRDHWSDMKDVVLANETSQREGLVDFEEKIEDLPEGGKVLGEIHHDGLVYVRGVFPIYDTANEKLGAIFVIQDVTNMSKGLTLNFEKTIILILVLMVVLCYVMVKIFNDLILNRLNAMNEKVTRLVGGDFHNPIVPHADDEVGRFETLLEKFRLIFVDVLKELESKLDKK